MPVKKIISAAAKGAAKKAGKKAKVISSKQMTKRLQNKVDAKDWGMSPTNYKKWNSVMTKMTNAPKGSALREKLSEKALDMSIRFFKGPKAKPKPKGPIVMSEKAAKKSGRNLKPIPGTRRVVKKSYGGPVHNNRGMSVPGMRYGR